MFSHILTPTLSLPPVVLTRIFQIGENQAYKDNLLLCARYVKGQLHTMSEVAKTSQAAMW